MLEKLTDMWKKKYITIETLKKWVDLNELNPSLGITEDEFQQIINIAQ